MAYLDFSETERAFLVMVAGALAVPAVGVLGHLSQPSIYTDSGILVGLAIFVLGGIWFVVSG